MVLIRWLCLKGGEAHEHEYNHCRADRDLRRDSLRDRTIQKLLGISLETEMGTAVYLAVPDSRFFAFIFYYRMNYIGKERCNTTCALAIDPRALV